LVAVRRNDKEEHDKEHGMMMMAEPKDSSRFLLKRTVGLPDNSD
jgi:hypothetical protein